MPQFVRSSSVAQSLLSFAEADVGTTTCLNGGVRDLATADSGMTD